MLFFSVLPKAVSFRVARGLAIDVRRQELRLGVVYDKRPGPSPSIVIRPMTHLAMKDRIVLGGP